MMAQGGWRPINDLNRKCWRCRRVGMVFLLPLPIDRHHVHEHGLWDGVLLWWQPVVRMEPSWVPSNDGRVIGIGGRAGR
jgi:hypothetical protein